MRQYRSCQISQYLLSVNTASSHFYLEKNCWDGGRTWRSGITSLYFGVLLAHWSDVTETSWSRMSHGSFLIMTDNHKEYTFCLSSQALSLHQSLSYSYWHHCVTVVLLMNPQLCKNILSIFMVTVCYFWRAAAPEITLWSSHHLGNNWTYGEQTLRWATRLKVLFDYTECHFPAIISPPPPCILLTLCQLMSHR